MSDNHSIRQRDPMSDMVLIVDDDSDVRRLLETSLEVEGFHTRAVADGAQALSVFDEVSPDLVILDVLMPGMSGTELCRELRQRSSVPILFLSGRGEDIDRIIGLELGADDYMSKPFNPRELVARCRAILRRTSAQSEPEESDSILRHARLRVDTERFEATFDGEELELTKTEFNLLRTLMRRPGKVYSRDELIDGAYEDQIHVSDRTIDSHIRRLRNKLHDLGADPIETVRGIGYKLVESKA